MFKLYIINCLIYEYFLGFEVIRFFVSVRFLRHKDKFFHHLAAPISQNAESLTEPRPSTVKLYTIANKLYVCEFVLRLTKTIIGCYL